MLGYCRNHGAQRFNQRTDWPGISHRDDFYFSPADRKAASPLQATARLQLFGFSADCHAMASTSRLSQSSPGTGQGVFLVLFCQRTLFALSEQTLPGGL